MRKSLLVVVLVGAVFGVGYLASRDAAPAPSAPAAKAVSGSAAAPSAPAASGGSGVVNPWSEGTGALTFADAKAATLYNKLFSEDERRAALASRDVEMSASGADVLRLLLRASLRGRAVGESEEEYVDRRVSQLVELTFKAPLADVAKAGRDAAVKSASEKLGFVLPPFSEKFVWSSYRRPDGSAVKLFVPADALFFAQQANACAQDASNPCHQDALKLGAPGAFAAAAKAFLSRDAAAYAASYDAGSLRKGFVDLLGGAPSADPAALALFAQIQPFAAAARGALGDVRKAPAPEPLSRYALPSGGLASDFANFVTYYWASAATGATFPLPTDNGVNPALPKSSK